MGQSFSEVEWDEFLSLEAEGLWRLGVQYIGPRLNLHKEKILKSRVTGVTVAKTLDGGGKKDLASLLEDALGIVYVKDREAIVQGLIDLKKKGALDAERRERVNCPLDWLTRRLLSERLLFYISEMSSFEKGSRGPLWLGRKLERIMRDQWRDCLSGGGGGGGGGSSGSSSSGNLIRFAFGDIKLVKQCLNFILILRPGCFRDANVLMEVFAAGFWGLNIVVLRNNEVANLEWEVELNYGEYLEELLPVDQVRAIHSAGAHVRDCISSLKSVLNSAKFSHFAKEEEDIIEKLRWVRPAGGGGVDRSFSDVDTRIAQEAREWESSVASQRVNSLIKEKNVATLKRVSLLAGRDREGRKSLHDAGLLKALVDLYLGGGGGGGGVGSPPLHQKNYEISVWMMRCIAELSSEASKYISPFFFEYDAFFEKLFRKAMNALDACTEFLNHGGDDGAENSSPWDRVFMKKQQRTDAAAAWKRAATRVVFANTASKMRRRLSILKARNFAEREKHASERANLKKESEKERNLLKNEFFRLHGGESGSAGSSGEDFSKISDLLKISETFSSLPKEESLPSIDGATLDERDSYAKSFEAICNVGENDDTQQSHQNIGYAKASFTFRRSGLSCIALAHVWRYADQDNDGALSLSEWMSALHCINHAQEWWSVDWYPPSLPGNSKFLEKLDMKTVFEKFENGSISTCDFFLRLHDFLGPSLEVSIKKIIRFLSLDAAERLCEASRVFVISEEFRESYQQEMSKRLSRREQEEKEEEEEEEEEGEGRKGTGGGASPQQQLWALRSIQLWACRSLERIFREDPYSETTKRIAKTMLSRGAAFWLANIVQIFDEERDEELITAALYAFTVFHGTCVDPPPLVELERPSTCKKLAHMLGSENSRESTRLAIVTVFDLLFSSGSLETAQLAAMAAEPLVALSTSVAAAAAAASMDSPTQCALENCLIACISHACEWDGVVRRFANFDALNIFSNFVAAQGLGEGEAMVDCEQQKSPINSSKGGGGGGGGGGGKFPDKEISRKILRGAANLISLSTEKAHFEKSSRNLERFAIACLGVFVFDDNLLYDATRLLLESISAKKTTSDLFHHHCLEDEELRRRSLMFCSAAKVLKNTRDKDDLSTSSARLITAVLSRPSSKEGNDDGEDQDITSTTPLWGVMKECLLPHQLLLDCIDALTILLRRSSLSRPVVLASLECVLAVMNVMRSGEAEKAAVPPPISIPTRVCSFGLKEILRASGNFPRDREIQFLTIQIAWALVCKNTCVFGLGPQREKSARWVEEQEEEEEESLTLRRAEFVESGGYQALMEASVFLKDKSLAQVLFCQAALALVPAHFEQTLLREKDAFARLVFETYFARSLLDSEEVLMEHACALLRDGLLMNQLLVPAERAAAFLLRAMKSHITCRASGLRALGLLAPHLSEEKADLMPLLSRCFLESPSSLEIFRNGCTCATSFFLSSSKSPGMRVRGVEADIHQIAFDVFSQNFAEIEEAARDVCEVLAHMTNLSGYNRILVGKSPVVINGLSQSLQFYKHSTSVQRWACVAVAHLCVSDDPSSVTLDLVRAGFPGLLCACLHSAGLIFLDSPWEAVEANASALHAVSAASYAMSKISSSSSEGRAAIYGKDFFSSPPSKNEPLPSTREIVFRIIFETSVNLCPMKDFTHNLTPPHIVAERDEEDARHLVHWCCILVRELCLQQQPQEQNFSFPETLLKAFVRIASHRECWPLETRFASLSALLVMSEVDTSVSRRIRLGDFDVEEVIAELLHDAMRKGTHHIARVACALCVSFCHCSGLDCRRRRHHAEEKEAVAVDKIEKISTSEAAATFNPRLMTPAAVVGRYVLNAIARFRHDASLQKDALQALVILTRNPHICRQLLLSESPGRSTLHSFPFSKDALTKLFTMLDSAVNRRRQHLDPKQLFSLSLLLECQSNLWDAYLLCASRDECRDHAVDGDGTLLDAVGSEAEKHFPLLIDILNRCTSLKVQCEALGFLRTLLRLAPVKGDGAVAVGDLRESQCAGAILRAVGRFSRDRDVVSSGLSAAGCLAQAAGIPEELAEVKEWLPIFVSMYGGDNEVASAILSCAASLATTAAAATSTGKGGNCALHILPLEPASSRGSSTQQVSESASIFSARWLISLTLTVMECNVSQQVTQLALEECLLQAFAIMKTQEEREGERRRRQQQRQQRMDHARRRQSSIFRQSIPPPPKVSSSYFLCEEVEQACARAVRLHSEDVSIKMVASRLLDVISRDTPLGLQAKKF